MICVRGTADYERFAVLLSDTLIWLSQAWLVVLLVITARSQAPYVIAGGIALLSVLALPPRLWRPQLKRLGLLALLLFVTTAIFAGQLSQVLDTQQANNLPVSHIYCHCAKCKCRYLVPGLRERGGWDLQCCTENGL